MPFDHRLPGILGMTACLLAVPVAAQQAPQTTINIYPPGTTPPPAGQAQGGAPAAAPQAAAAPAAAPAASGAKEATATMAGTRNQGTTQLTARVLSATREANTLMMRVAFENKGGVDANVVLVHGALADAYIVDPSGQRRASPMKDPQGHALASDMAASQVPAGQTRELFVQFPSPPPGVGSISLYLKGFPPIMGVPVT